MLRTASTSVPASDVRSSSPRSAKVTNVTPARSATAGSMSWGRARSTRAIGPGAAATAARLTSTPFAPAQATTTSASATSPATALSGAQRAAYSAARRSARSGVRLTTTTSPAPRRTTVATVSAAMAPAPTTTTRRPVRSGQRAVESGRDQGRRRAVDAGLGMGALADPQGLLEEGVEHRADGALLLPEAEGVAGLAEDLRLADGHRVQSGGHAEEVGHRAVVVVDVEVRRRGRRRCRSPVRAGAPRCPRRCRGSGRPRRRSRAGCRWRPRSPRRRGGSRARPRSASRRHRCRRSPARAARSARTGARCRRRGPS